MSLIGTAFVPQKHIEEFATLADSATTAFAAGGETPAINLPGDISAGNLLVLEITVIGPAIATPSGWTLTLSQVLSGLTNVRLYVFHKIASGSEGETVTITGGYAFGMLAAITRRYTGAASVVGTVASAVSQFPNPPTLSGTQRKYVWIAGAACYGYFATISGYPAGYADQIQSISSIEDYNLVLISMSRSAEVASEDPATYTMVTTNYWAAYTLAVEPA